MADFVEGLLHYLLGDATKQLTAEEDARERAELNARVQRAMEEARTYAARKLIPEDPAVAATPPPPSLALGGPAPGAEPADDWPSFTTPTSVPEAPADVEFSLPPGTIEVALTVSDGGSATGTPLTEGPPVTTTFTPPAPAAATSEPATAEPERGMSTFEPVTSTGAPTASPTEPPTYTLEPETLIAAPAAAAPAEPAAETVTFGYRAVETTYKPAAPATPGRSGSALSLIGTAGWWPLAGLAAVLLAVVIAVLVAHSRGSSSTPTGSRFPTTPTTPVTQPGSSFNNILLPNNTLAFVGDVCKGGTLHVRWTLTGIAPNTPVVIRMSGRGLPPSVTYQADPGQPFGQDFPISGAGTWSTTIVSIGGQPPPPAVAPDAVHSGPYAC